VEGFFMVIKKCTLFIVLALLGQSAFSQVYTNSKKIVAVSTQDVLSIRQDVAIAKKIVKFLWRKDLRTNFFIYLGPLFNVLFDKKVSVEKLIADYPSLAKYKNKLYKIVAMSETMHETVDLLKELKRQGVLLVLAPDSAHDVVDYAKAKNPEMYGLFDSYYFDPENKQKSDKSFYTKFREKINELAAVTHAHEVLFVDSNKAHADAANKANLNIVPHLFINATEFKEELIKKGYLV
jgi:hypothetical protein